MSKTTRNFKGKDYTPTSRQQQKKLAKGKFMGFTDGVHSHGFTEYATTTTDDGKVITDYSKIIKTDKAPVKNVDYIKYGYPHDTRHNKVIKNKIIMDSFDEDLRAYYDQI